MENRPLASITPEAMKGSSTSSSKYETTKRNVKVGSRETVTITRQKVGLRTANNNHNEEQSILNAETKRSVGALTTNEEVKDEIENVSSLDDTNLRERKVEYLLKCPGTAGRIRHLQGLNSVK